MTSPRRNTETEENLNLRRVVIASLFVIGNLYFTYLLVRGASSGYTAWRLQFTGQVVMGLVTGQKEARDAKPHIVRYYPVIEYRVNGQAYTVSSYRSSGIVEYPTGAQVEVVYDPSDPSIARINTWEEVWFPSEFTFIFVPIASALGNLALFRARLRYKERLDRYKEWQQLNLRNDS